MYIINQINNIMRKLMLFVLAVILGIAGANAQGTGTVVVADGTTTNSNVPFYGTFADDNYQRSQVIYPESILSDITGAEIQGITWYLNSAAVAFNGTFELKIGISDANAFESAAFDETTVLTTVYTGSFDCSGTEVTLNFSTPFTYTGGNLIIDFSQTTLSSSYRGTSFKGETSANASVYGKNGSSVASITASSANFIPKTGFIVPVSCVSPTLGTITPEARAAAVAWTENGSATAWQLKLNDGEWLDVTENPYTLTSLTPETAYNLQLRSNCGGGDFSIPVSSSFTTLVSCPAPTTLTATAAETSLELTWVENGSATEWLMKVDDGNYQSVTSPYTLTGLTANTAYAIQIRALCGAGDTSSAVSGTYRTLCGFESIPYSEDFEGISSGIPDCWEQEASNASRAKWDFNASGHSGNCLNFNDWYAENSRLILPVMDCSSLTSDGQLGFYFKNPAISNGLFAHLVIYYRTSSTDEWTAIDGWTLTAANEDWTAADVILPNSANAPYYQISFLATGEDTSPRVYMYLDDITVGEAPACVRPSNLTAAATENSLELSWTENGTASKWVVKVNDGDWATVTENPYTLTGLTANTEYSVSVRSFCDPDTSEAFSATFRTACAAEVVTTDDSFEEEFEGITSGIPSCWAQTDAVWKSYTTGNTGRGLYFSDYYSGEDTLITPEFNFAALNNGAQLSFWYKMPEAEDWYGDTYSATLEVLYRASTSGEWTVGETLTEAVEDWTKYELFLPSSTNAASYQIAFRAVSSSGYTSTYVYLDGVVVTVPPACPKPSALTLDAATETSLTLSWTENGSATKWVVKVDDGAWTETTENPYTINGLTANTEYSVSVRSFCDPDTSEAVSGTFRTACGIETLPYAENFESTIDCWEQEAIAGTNTWVLDDNYYTAYEGSHYLALDNGYDQERRIISPVINLTGAENVTLAFAHAQATWGSDQDSLKVEYRLSETDEWHVLATYTTAISSWQVENLSIDQTSATFQFAFHGYSNYGRPIAIDSVVLSGSGAVANCDVPTALAAGNVTANSAVITWNGTATQYEVELNGETSTVNTNSHTAQGLTAATEYTVRVRALCDGGLTSDWTAAVNFTTLDEPQPMECNTPTGLAASNVTANSANISWNEVTIAETFDGEWNLAMGAEDSVHTMITPDATMHTLLTALGMDFEDVDENVSVAGTLVPVTIEPAAGNQMNVTGSFDMAMYGVDDPVTFHFSTTGTVTSTGMNIEPATINETVRIMNAMDIDYTGTVTFAQPTALPVDGNLTIGIASMNISGYGDTTVNVGIAMTGSVSISMVGTNLTASGSRETTNAYPTYELVVTNVATGVETPITNATTPYALEGLTASTEYTVKVRTHCDENSTSDWSAAVSFTTLNGGGEDPTCDVPTNIVIDQESINTPYAALITWNGTASQYEIEITGGEQPVTTTVSTNSYTFNGVASTTYSVRVRAICDGGVTSDWSAAQSFTTPNGGEPQGIDDVNASYSVNIYPNPAKNTVTISVDGLNGKAQVSVIDMSGRTVMTSTMESNATQLNVSKLAQGTYFVRINGETISTVRKLVVK